MSLERKDIRAKLDHNAHAKLRTICEAMGMNMGDWIEQKLVPLIDQEAHVAMVIAHALLRQGITWEKPVNMMTLKEWCKKERGRTSQLAKNLGVTPHFIHRVNFGHSALPATHAHAVEVFTAGLVGRRTTRPADWWRIWPELVTEEFPIPSAAQPPQHATLT